MNFKEMPVIKEKLTEEQCKDPDFQKFYDKLTAINDLENLNVCCYLQSGVIRKYMPFNISADDTSKTILKALINFIQVGLPTLVQ